MQDRDGRRDPPHPGSAHLPESSAPGVNTGEQHLAAIFLIDACLSDELHRPKRRQVRGQCRLVNLRLLFEAVLALLRLDVAVTVPERKAGEFVR